MRILEAAEGPAGQMRQKFKQLLIESDGYFIATPEYNSMLSPLLKNAIDWVSRPTGQDGEPYHGKVAAIGSASPGGLGGIRGLPILRLLLSNIGVHVVPNQIALGGAFQAFDDNGVLKDEGQAGMLDGVVSQLVETATGQKAEQKEAA